MRRNNKNIISQTTITTVYAYDAANHLTRFTDTDSGATSYAYDNSGNLTRKDNANSTYTTYAYNNRNRLTNIEHKKSDNSTIASFTYLYDYAGNRTQVTEADSSSVSYAYDDITESIIYFTVRHNVHVHYGNTFARWSVDVDGSRDSCEPYPQVPVGYEPVADPLRYF